MTNKTDYAIGGIIGFFSGIFIIPVLINLGQTNPALKNYAVLMLVPWAMAIAILFGIWLGKFLAHSLPVFNQLSKFAAVGILNTAMDFGTLNLFSLVTGTTAGIKIGGLNIIGVVFAVVNSYFWNKYWVFSHGAQTRQEQDLQKFLAVTISSLIINSVLVVVLTTYITPPFGLSGATWLNAAKVFITAFSLVWNFVGYKFFVFVTKSSTA